MNYVVSARKYRPATFEDVIGQEHITTTLKNAILTDKLAHAFLFCGPRGVGKTTCARLLAKVVNMPDPKSALEDGSYADTDIDISLNIIELDAASNNSVEHIRTLIEQVRFQPQQGTYKVFIIDEVHMLSQAAFNAFLKTLEEPPPYAIFILATTERHKILPTILSRCQLYDFRRIGVSAIISQLEAIAKKENIATEHDALYVIAEKADGSMRDALSIFDRMAASSDAGITYEAVVRNLSMLDLEYFFEATRFVLTEDGPGMILLLDKILNLGFEGDTFMNGFSKHLRNLMYCKQDSTLSLLEVSDQLKNRYIEQANMVSNSTILTALNIANTCDVDYPQAKDKRLHVEIALLKMTYAGRRQTAEKKSEVETSDPPVQEAQVTESPEPLPSKQFNPAKPAGSPEQPGKDDAVSSDTTEKVVAKKDLSGTRETMRGIALKPNLQDTPLISSVDELIASAQSQIDTTNHERRSLDLDEITEMIIAYGAGKDSPTTKAILNQSIVEIVGEEIRIFVPTTIAREEIQQEVELFGHIREHFNQHDLLIDVTVDRDKFPDIELITQKKMFTPKEKYDHLVNKNPLIADLISALNLKVDQE
jgi:DNA polymerase-3 subunit gamma/tau